MELARVYARASAGVKAPLVTVDVHLSAGLPGFSMVGLPATAVKESKDRVRSAILTSELEFPLGRITVNLAPADLPKQGGRFDLAIAVGILAASGQLSDTNLLQYEFAAELALNGELRPVRGALPLAIECVNSARELFTSVESAREAALSQRVKVYAAESLTALVKHFRGEAQLARFATQAPEMVMPHYPDLKEVKGQSHGKRALEIAAAGGHSLLLSGPPGTGKTMLASRLPGILPLMTEDESLSMASVCSISTQGFDLARWRVRPFRCPHHSASSVALVGGGNPPKPGEISLAHEGVLFLDELPEFNRHVLEALREPLEAGCVTISRASHQAEFPASFQLIAAMNPCPCGYLGDSRCRCTHEQVHRYQEKLSGPFLDRVDMKVEIPPLPKGLLSDDAVEGESSAKVRARVTEARERQLARSGVANAKLGVGEIKAVCPLSKANCTYLEKALEKLRLSARSYHRVLKLSRTIADMAGREEIIETDLAEALSYRAH